MKKLYIVFIVLLSIILSTANQGYSQNTKLSLVEAIKVAKEQSIRAFMAKHRFRSSYWNYRSYRASYLPYLSANSTLFNLNRSIAKNNVLENGQWVERYAESKSLNSSLGFSVMQQVPWTGGSIFMRSNLNRVDLLNGDPASWMTTPVSIGFSQPLFAYNEFKWERKTAPMQYEIAKKTYIESMEDVTRMTISNFFSLVTMKENLIASRKNRNKRDTLYMIAQGRFEMGIIDQADKMEMEQQYLQAKNTVIEDSLKLMVEKARFNTFMRFTQGSEFDLIYDTILPHIHINVARAIELALENGSEVLNWEISTMNSESSVEQAKVRNRFNADLNVSYGLTQQGADFQTAYQDPRNSQSVQVSMSIPILDWGRRKGQVKMAESNHERTMMEIEQSQVDFEHNFFLQVSQFNLMNDLFLLRSKTDSISAIRFEITMQKYLKGQIDILKLNDAITAKDAARRSYISTISSFWSEYYAIRKATLFDFINDVPLTQDYDKIIE